MSRMDGWSTLSAGRPMRPATLVALTAAVVATGLAGWFVLGQTDDRSEADRAIAPASEMVGQDDSGGDETTEIDAAGPGASAVDGSEDREPVALVVSAGGDPDGSEDSTTSLDPTAPTSGPATSNSEDGTSVEATTTTADPQGGSPKATASIGGGTSTAVATSRPSASTGPPSTTAETTKPTATTTSTTSAPTPTSRPSTTQVPTSDGSGFRACRVPSGGSTRSVDFSALRRSGAAVSQLNRSGSPLRTVFELGSDRMSWGSEGLQLRVDIGDPAATNNRYRAEMRESVIDQPIPAGSTQAYCMRFRVDELPDLYGPVHIFQRFNRNLDGPDIGVELTGANQFSNAVPNDIQVVAWDGRNRIGAQLATINTLMVVVHNHATNGSYKVILNERVLRERSGLNTVGAAAGGWSQFGIYPHGLYDDDGSNRQDQLDSGRTVIRFQYRDFALTDYASGSSDLSGFTVG